MKILILIVIIYLFSSIVSAQDTNDTVILIWHKKNLNTLQLQEFDSLRNFIFNTYEDVVYFRQVCPNYPDGENYYHLRCGENRLSIMSQLSSKSNILDSIQFDKAVNNSEMGCVNPINVNDPLMINYYVSEMLDLPCAWYITIGSLNVNVALIDYNFYYNSSTVHPEIENKIENHYDLGDFGNCPNYRAPVDPDPSPPQYHGLQMTGIIAAECNNEIGICGAAYATKLNLYEININSDFFYSEIESAICFAVENQEKIVNISHYIIVLYIYMLLSVVV